MAARGGTCSESSTTCTGSSDRRVDLQGVSPAIPQRDQEGPKLNSMVAPTNDPSDGAMAQAAKDGRDSRFHHDSAQGSDGPDVETGSNGRRPPALFVSDDTDMEFSSPDLRPQRGTRGALGAAVNKLPRNGRLLEGEESFDWECPLLSNNSDEQVEDEVGGKAKA
ncbi:hypothetical protein OF83DRAFT_1089302, partial [Amylostereum chailletii]